MISPERRDYVNFRLEKAFESLKAAEILIESKLWSSVINRLYYSCYYAVNALLVAYEIETRTHSGLRNQFSLHFIKTNKIDKKYGELLSDLFDWRHQGDYGDLFEFEEEVVLEHIEPVKEFIKTIEEYINS